MKKQAVILLVYSFYSTLAAMEQQDAPELTKGEAALYAVAHHVAESPGLMRSIAAAFFERSDHMSDSEIVHYYERPDQQTNRERRSVLPGELVHAICHDYHILQCKDCITKVDQVHERLSSGPFLASRPIPSSLYFIDQLCPAFVRYGISKDDSNLKYLLIYSCESSPHICCPNIFDIHVITKQTDFMTWQKRAREFITRKNLDIEQVFVLIATLMKHKADMVIAHNKACFAITGIDDRCLQPGSFYQAIVQTIEQENFKRFPELNNAIEFLKLRVTID